MDDYISRQAAYEALTDYYHHRTEIQHMALHEALNRVPSADIDLSGFSDKLWKTAYERGKVEAVRHGRWIYDRLITTTGETCDVKRCSECDSYYQYVGHRFNYCPHCGALMDEVAQ